MTILLEAARYAAVNAQTRGLLARLTPDALWIELVAASTLDEQLDILHRSKYADRLADVIRGEPTVAHLVCQSHSSVQRSLQQPGAAWWPLEKTDVDE